MTPETHAQLLLEKAEAAFLLARAYLTEPSPAGHYSWVVTHYSPEPGGGSPPWEGGGEDVERGALEGWAYEEARFAEACLAAVEALMEQERRESIAEAMEEAVRPTLRFCADCAHAHYLHDEGVGDRPEDSACVAGTCRCLGFRAEPSEVRP